MIEIPFDLEGKVEFQDYDEITRRIKKFDRYSDIGKDQSGLYSMYLIEMGTPTKPAILITGVQHGTEWQGAQYSLSFMEMLRDNTFPDESFRDRLLNDYHILFIPVVNPWGLEETYDHAITRGRNNSTNTNLNRDFDEFTQQETINVRNVMDRHTPFAYFDLHLIRGHQRDTHLIIGNGQPETNYIRDMWTESLSEYANQDVERWDGSPGINRGLSRRYMRDQANPHTPFTLSYISEISRPVQENAGFNAPLSNEDIYKYGVANMYLFFKTSLDYYLLHNDKSDTVIEDKLYVRDLNGEEYPVQATVTQDYELNGNQSLTATILPTKVNKSFISDISEMWELIDFDGVTYKIIYAKRQGAGNLLTVEIKAVPLFFDTFNNLRIYEEYERHMTSQFAFNLIFETTGYNFILIGQFDAVDWQGFGKGESRLQTFERALERYKAEFRIVGKTVFLERQIGRDTSFMYRYKLNATNIVQEADANEMWTYAKGFGDYEDSEDSNPKLEEEYTSPLAKVLGKRHAPPIYDGRVTDETTMKNALKALVDESLKISVSTDIVDLRNQGYELAQPEMGDRVFLIDERIGLNEEVRIVNISAVKDWRGHVIKLNLIIGNVGLTKRYQSNMSTAVDRINDLIDGRAKLPFSVLDDAVINATKALKDAQTELDINGNGILAIDKQNPNNVTILNSAGLGVSTDGGHSITEAVTGRGINASAVITGTMIADFIAGGTLASLNGGTDFNLNTGVLRMDTANFILGGGAYIQFTTTSNRVQFRSTDDGVTRSSGIGVGRGASGRPFAHLGVTGAADLDSLSEFHSGFIASSTKTISEGGTNSVNGYRFQIRNKASGWDKGVTFDFDGRPTISFTNGHENSYTMGSESAPLANLYNDRIYSRRLDIFNPNSSSDLGYVFTTTRSSSNTPAHFRPRHADKENYYLGTVVHPWYRIYSENGVEKGSDERLKREISENQLGLDFLNMVETYQYRLREKNIEYGESRLSYGIIAQQAVGALQDYGVDVEDLELLSMGENGMYGVQYDQFTPMLIKAVQELSGEINQIKEMV